MGESEESEKTEKIVVGLMEKVRLNGHEVVARIDTGAARSSVDLDLASKLKLGPIVSKSTIISSQGRSVRPVVKAKIEIGGKRLNCFFNIVSRDHMRYKILIGRNILKRGFLVDPSVDSLKKFSGK